MHFTATLRIPHAPGALEPPSFNGCTALSTAFLPLTWGAAYAPFKPNKSG